MRSSFAFAPLSFALTFSACGEGVDPATPVAPAAPPPAAVQPDPPASKPARVSCTPCAMYTGTDGREAECAHVEVPLDWSDPEGKKAVFFVKRVLGTAKKRRQVWLLQGGPGGAGDGFEDIAWSITRRDTSL